MRTCERCGIEIKNTDLHPRAKYCDACRDLMKGDKNYFRQYQDEIKKHFETVGYPLGLVSVNYIKYNTGLLARTKLTTRGRSRALRVFLVESPLYELISRSKFQRID